MYWHNLYFMCMLYKMCTDSVSFSEYITVGLVTVKSWRDNLGLSLRSRLRSVCSSNSLCNRSIALVNKAICVFKYQADLFIVTEE